MESGPVIAGLLTLLGATWSALIAGFYRGDFVPGHVYRAEVKRGTTEGTQNVRNALSIRTLAKAHEAERAEHVSQLAAKDQEIAGLRKQLKERLNAPSG